MEYDITSDHLHVAHRNGNSALLQRLVEMGARKGDKKDLLKTVSVLGYSDSAQYLISAGANVNNKSAFQLACKNGHHAVVECLLRAGANVKNESALKLACRYGHLTIIKCLLRAGADVHV